MHHFRTQWCITSAPLVLGFDLTNTSLLSSIYDIIANPRAIAVNQAWAGAFFLTKYTHTHQRARANRALSSRHTHTPHTHPHTALLVLCLALFAVNLYSLFQHLSQARTSALAGHPGRLVANSSKTFVARTAHGAGGDCRLQNCENGTMPVTQVLTKPLVPDNVTGQAQQAVLTINLSPVEQEGLAIDLAQLGLAGWCKTPKQCVESVTEVWSGKKITDGPQGGLPAKPIGSFRLLAHSSKFVVLKEIS
eukprot:SAG22_NODE_3679_length_1581_cov_1.323212_2_plen_249_part_00